MIVRDVSELVVLNDKAHHIHDPPMAWFKSIEDIHHRMVQKGSGLSLQVDVSATPKRDNGAIFVQTVSDYPLVEAISQNVVKHPVLPDAASRAKLVERQGAKYTEKYSDYIDLGVIEWLKTADGRRERAEKPLVVEVDEQNEAKDLDRLDIQIPLLARRIYREYKNLSELDIGHDGFHAVPYQEFSDKQRRGMVAQGRGNRRDCAHDDSRHCPAWPTIAAWSVISRKP